MRKINVLDTKKVPIGISIPLTESSTAFFAQTYSTADQYKTNILNLIMTAKGERRMVPSYGSNIRKRVFEQDTNLIDVLRNDIETAFSEWMPEVTIVNLEVYKRNDNDHAFLIKLFYSLPFNSDIVYQIEAEIK